MASPCVQYFYSSGVTESPVRDGGSKRMKLFDKCEDRTRWRSPATYNCFGCLFHRPHSSTVILRGGQKTEWGNSKH